MNKGMRVGYARVSTAGQKLDFQLERFADYDRVYHEKVSGKYVASYDHYEGPHVVS